MRSPPVPPVGQEGRIIKPLPARALQVVGRGAQEEVINWKMLFKLGENWRKGACILRSSRTGALISFVRPVHPSDVWVQSQHECSYPGYRPHGF